MEDKRGEKVLQDVYIQSTSIVILKRDAKHGAIPFKVKNVKNNFGFVVNK